MERLQRRATRIPDCHKGLIYESRPNVWGLTTLKMRRVRGDLIQMYKIVHGIEELTWHKGPKCFPIDQEATFRSCKKTNINNMSIQREIFGSTGHFVTVRHNFYLNRVSETWNKLPNFVIDAPTLNSFKAKLDSNEIQQRLL